MLVTSLSILFCLSMQRPGTQRQVLCIVVHLHICNIIPLDNSRLTHTPSTAIHNGEFYESNIQNEVKHLKEHTSTCDNHQYYHM